MATLARNDKQFCGGCLGANRIVSFGNVLGVLPLVSGHAGMGADTGFSGEFFKQFEPGAGVSFGLFGGHPAQNPSYTGSRLADGSTDGGFDGDDLVHTGMAPALGTVVGWGLWVRVGSPWDDRQ